MSSFRHLFWIFLYLSLLYADSIYNFNRFYRYIKANLYISAREMGQNLPLGVLSLQFSKLHIRIFFN